MSALLDSENIQDILNTSLDLFRYTLYACGLFCSDGSTEFHMVKEMIAFAFVLSFGLVTALWAFTELFIMVLDRGFHT